MESPCATRQEWLLTQDALDHLLSFLDSNRDRAGRKYEEIRQRLMSFFRWRNCIYPEKYADQTIDRVARKIDSGTEVNVRDPYPYFYGVALNILKEQAREIERARSALAEFQNVWRSTVQEDAEISCLDRCLEKLSASQRKLVLAYYSGGEASIENRRRLAADMGISSRELTHRVFRIRTTLKSCVFGCVGKEQG